MLACAVIARVRYYPPGSLIAKLRDPVVTSNGDRLRFESFSGCCGVHARLDLLPAALDEAPRVSGTTNVDFNQPMRAALAGAAAGGPLLLSAGTDEAGGDDAGSVTERRVPLPSRWLKGLGGSRRCARRHETPGRGTVRLPRRAAVHPRPIPRQAARPLWAVPARTPAPPCPRAPARPACPARGA